MLISDLIKELEKIRQEHGNVQVCVEHADLGGSYGTAGEVEIFFDKRNLVYLEPGEVFNDKENSYPVAEDKNTILDFCWHLRMWMEETQFKSTGILDNYHFEELVKMGKTALPLIIKEIRDNHNYRLVYVLDKILPGMVNYDGFISLEKAGKTWIGILEDMEKCDG